MDVLLQNNNMVISSFENYTREGRYFRRVRNKAREIKVKDSLNHLRNSYVRRTPYKPRSRVEATLLRLRANNARA